MIAMDVVQTEEVHLQTVDVVRLQVEDHLAVQTADHVVDEAVLQEPEATEHLQETVIAGVIIAVAKAHHHGVVVQAADVDVKEAALLPAGKTNSATKNRATALFFLLINFFK